MGAAIISYSPSPTRQIDPTNLNAIEAVKRLEGKEVGTVLDQDERAKQFVQKVMTEKRIPGLQISIIKNNQIELCESYGLANVENQFLSQLKLCSPSTQQRKRLLEST